MHEDSRAVYTACACFSFVIAVCKHPGQILAVPENRCQYKICALKQDHWKYGYSSYGDMETYLFYCAYGTAVPEWYEGKRTVVSDNFAFKRYLDECVLHSVFNELHFNFDVIRFPLNVAKTD